MDYSQARQKFIEKWGEMGAKWGICKTMAQIHALLLISPKELCSDEIMEVLQISRGNVCMNLKALVDWGLIYKTEREGSRKEYYIAEKDILSIFRQIVIHRKKEELEPILELLDECSDVEGQCTHSQEFCKVIKDIKVFSTKADATLDVLMKTNPNWFMNSFIRMIS